MVAPLTIWVLEPVSIRTYQDGNSYGICSVLTDSSNFKSIGKMFVAKEHLDMVKRPGALMIINCMILDGGAIKVTSASKIMQASLPADAGRQAIIDKFIKPEVVSIASIFIMESGTRTSVRGVVQKVTDVIKTATSERKQITITDGSATIELKLWGDKTQNETEQGGRYAIYAVEVTGFQGVISLNSTVSTVIEAIHDVEQFEGTIVAASFTEDDSSIFINGELLNIAIELLDSLYPNRVFKQIQVTGTKVMNDIRTITKCDEDRDEY